MNIPILSEKDYVSVLPRIIDPKMQFTKESIEKTFDNKKVLVDNNKYKTTNEVEFNEKSIDKNRLDVGVESSSFLSDYKYVIIIVIIVITLIVIYFIYKYYTKEKPADPKIAETEENLNIEESKSKEKTETVNTYLSSYIQDDENEETENVSSEQENENVLELDNYKNTNVSISQPEKEPTVFGAAIIVSEFDISNTIPKNNINTSRVEEIIENITDYNTKKSYNYDSLTDDIPIMENKNEINEMVSYTSKNVELEVSEDKQNLDEIIQNINQNEDSEEEDYKSLLDIDENETMEQKKDSESETKLKHTKKKENGSSISKPKKINSSDDITYFQKFSKTT